MDMWMLTPEKHKTYGAVKIHDRLVDVGRTVSCRRVPEVMAKHRAYGVCGRQPGMRTTLRDVNAASFADLVDDGSSRVDLTSSGMATSRICGSTAVLVLGHGHQRGHETSDWWAFADHMRTDLVSWL